jgi:ElaB/YqjD/DUF883 family membrane-anchored ribosome-binding protein
MSSHHRTEKHGNGKDHIAGITDSVREIGEHLRGAASENYEQAKDTAADYYEQGRQKAMEWEDDVVKYIRRKPLQSIAIALGTGMLLGKYWR